MAFVESLSVEKLYGMVSASSTLPINITPANGLLLLFVAIFSVRAFVQPRSFVHPDAGPKSAADPKRPTGLGRLRNTVRMLAGPAPVAQENPRPTAPQSTKLLQGAFTALLDEVYVFDPDSFEVSFMNAKAEKRAAMAKLSKRPRFPEILPQKNRQVILEAARNLRRSSLDSIVFELMAADVPTELTLKLIREDGEDEYFMAILRDLSARAEEAQAQADYVATLSHEMRTPLTSIKGAVELIASGKMGELSGGAAATLGVAQRNVDRLLRLTNDILDLEKMDAGKLRCDLDRLDLGDLAREAAQDILGYARQFDVSVRVVQKVNDSVVQADRARLMQVMANLLSNAIKFSSPDQEVLISIEDAGTDLRVSVVDSGPGIPEANRHDVFEPYLQGPQVQRKVASTGLGLSIAKRIVEAHSGSIGFETTLGEGTAFFFELPKLVQESEAAA
ncbi:sensor histidine kinase [Thalassobius sp. S69A]|uniref:sensor histidine kinase n=1 Tax=unclassified Thalassovita TaxID=2619711 RepID=UPI003C7DFC1E